MEQKYCNWVQFYGNYNFIGSCGLVQGRNVRPKQTTCSCKGRIRRFIQSQNGELKEVKCICIRKGNAYYEEIVGF